MDTPPCRFYAERFLGPARCLLVQGIFRQAHNCFFSKRHLLQQVGFWDGSVAVVRLQPTTPTSNTHISSPQGSQQAGQLREAQHDMVVLTHFQVDPTPLRAVAWCPPQVHAHSSGLLLHLLHQGMTS